MQLCGASSSGAGGGLIRRLIDYIDDMPPSIMRTKKNA